MARIPHPWFWKNRAQWCVNLDGQRRILGPHPDGCPVPKKINGRWNAPSSIMQEFHKLMAHAPKKPAAAQLDDITSVEIFDKYLDWCSRHRAPRTYEWYRDHIQAFINH